MAKMKKPALRYEEADEQAYGLMAEVIRDHFPEIRDLATPLKIALLMANNGGLVFESALKEHGRGVPALSKKSKTEERARGGPDVYILVDLNRWNERGDQGRMAILARELCRVDFKHESEKKGGGIKYDAYDRPVVKLIPYDWVLTGFRAVCEWYGTDAVEYQAVRDVQKKLAQLGLPFSDDEERTVRAVEEMVDREAKGSAAITSKAVIEETFRTLLSLGHNESQARDIIEHAMDRGRVFGTVTEMVEAIYNGFNADVPATIPAPLSVSFSGKDFDVIEAAGKELRRKGRKTASAAV